jgi:hypothetical protein
MSMSTLEVLHLKIRELGNESTYSKFPAMHKGTFAAIAAGSKPITPAMEDTIVELWPEYFVEEKEATTDQVAPAIGANQLNFTILAAVRNTYDPSTVNTIVQLVRRTGCGWIQRPFDSMIARSRNMLAAAFLKSDFDWSFWIDDDMIIPAGNAAFFRREIGLKENQISDEFAGLIAPYQLASHPNKFVSGVYFNRHGANQITAGFPKGTSLKGKLPSRSVLPVNYCGFGCAMVHRSVYEDILKLHPELWDGTSEECQVFSTFQNGNRMVGEDEAMGIRANEAGHPCILDCSVIAGHCGRIVNFIPENL